MGAVFSSSSPQVFINFRGQDVRNDFLDSLVDKMKTENINVFIDKHEVRGLALEDLFMRIEESKVAIVIFSKNFTNSPWCLNERARIKDCVDRGTLIAIPIFYKMKPSVEKDLTGDFGLAFRTLKYENRHDPVTEKWEKAIVSMTQRHGMELQEHRFVFRRFSLLLFYN
ncbi:unnamed protein product [Arabis nemorensis]|uniref:TIR domain-containing protein n=1 Tax=Arabis nemorensis TaxID=586526 RepID=A0A565C2W0_9BRAS|nr:unnamed protein product [Arabis nemorensis]